MCNRLIIGIALTYMHTHSAWSMIMTASPLHQIRLSLTRLSVEDPGGQAPSRSCQGLSWRSFMKTNHNQSQFAQNILFGYQVDIDHDVDNGVSSRRFDVVERFHNLSFKGLISILYIMRYSLSFGSGVMVSRTEYRGISAPDEGNPTRTSPTANLELAVDYQIREFWEISLFYKKRYRPSSDKTDSGFGVGVSYNLI